MGERKALIVTCSVYDDPGLEQLRAPVHDAEALEKILTDPEVGNYKVNVVSDKQRNAVAKAILKFFAQPAHDDLLLLYISGHGIKDEDGQLHLACKDTELTSVDATAVSADFVTRQINKASSRRVVLLLDCCYAGAFPRGMIPRADQTVHLGEQFQGTGLLLLTASKSTEYAFESGHLINGRGRPSVFTGTLVQGLTTGLADHDRDGWISFDDLYAYLYSEIPKVTPQQTPSKWTFDGVGDVRIARSRLGPLETVGEDRSASSPNVYESLIVSRVGEAIATASGELAEKRRPLTRGKWVPAAVHEAAVKTAVEEALTVQDQIATTISGASLYMAGRYKSLVERQLELITESSSTAKSSLDLEKLNRLSLRMRRESENLVLLMGGKAIREQENSIPLDEVVGDAAKEIDEGERIALVSSAAEEFRKIYVAGTAVADAVHILAELMENGLSFSPKTTQVMVAGQHVPAGYVVEIEDRGLGMSDEEIIRANEILARPPLIDLAMSRMIGLQIAGRRAGRHGIKIQLRHSWYGGVTALVLLPIRLLTKQE